MATSKVQIIRLGPLYIFTVTLSNVGLVELMGRANDLIPGPNYFILVISLAGVSPANQPEYIEDRLQHTWNVLREAGLVEAETPPTPIPGDPYDMLRFVSA